MFKSFVLLFLLGLSTIIKIELIGILTLSELILLFISPFVIIKALKFNLSNEFSRKVLLFGLLYLLSLIGTDLLRGTSTFDLQRGWSKVGILLFNFVLLTYLSKLNIKNFSWYFWGSGFGALINTIFLDKVYGDLWKYGMGPSVSVLGSLGIGSLGMSPIFGGLIFLSLGMFHLLMNARSLAGFTILSAFLFLIPVTYLNRINPLHILNLRIVLPMFLGLSAIYYLYDYGAPAGWFGEESKEKYLVQTSNNQNILIGGRSESSSSIEAILDSPIIGHGSWAKNDKYILLFLKAQGVDPSSGAGRAMLETKLIPTHSHLLGAWVEAGFLGFLFWLFAARLAVYGIFCSLRLSGIPNKLFILFILILFLWDLAFSPFGLERRMGNAAILVLAVALIVSYKTKIKQNRVNGLLTKKKL